MAVSLHSMFYDERGCPFLNPQKFCYTLSMHAFALGLVMLSFSGSVNAAQGDVDSRPALAVSVIENKTPNSEMDRVNLVDRLITTLTETRQFRVIERQKMDDLLKEQKFQLSGMTDPTKVSEIGKLLGADLMIFGGITRADQKKIDKFSYDEVQTIVELDIRGVDVKTAEIVFSQKVTGDNAQKIVTTGSGEVLSGSMSPQVAYAECALKAVEAVSRKIVEFYQPLGFVVSAKKGQIITNLGQRKGIRKGDKLSVYRSGDEMFDPETKESLGFSKEEVGTATVIDVDYKTSIASIDASIKVHVKDQVKKQEE